MVGQHHCPVPRCPRGTLSIPSRSLWYYRSQTGRNAITKTVWASEYSPEGGGNWLLGMEYCQEYLDLGWANVWTVWLSSHHRATSLPHLVTGGLWTGPGGNGTPPPPDGSRGSWIWYGISGTASRWFDWFYQSLRVSDSQSRRATPKNDRGQFWHYPTKGGGIRTASSSGKGNPVTPN